MSDSHNQAVSSTDISNLRLAIKNGVDDCVDQLVQIQEEAGPLSPECFEQVERQTLETCMGLARRYLKEFMERRDAQLPDAIEQDGRVLRRRKATPKTISTLMGSVTYRRSRYRTREAGASQVPVDESMGLISGHPARPIARVCVLLTSHCPARDARGILAEVGTASPSVSTLQRVTRSMNEELEKLPSEQRTRIRSAEDIPADTRSVSVSLDGVMVPLMKGEDGRSDGSWREASCGAVSFHDARGDRRKTLYFGRMPEAGKATLKAEIDREVARIRELAESRLPVLAVADAAPDNWRFLDGLKPDAEAVDFWHACQHLNVAAGHARAPEAWFQTWRRVLRDEPGGVDRVVRTIRYLRDKAPAQGACSGTGLLPQEPAPDALRRARGRGHGNRIGRRRSREQGPCRPADETQRHALADPLRAGRPVVPRTADIGPVRPDMVRPDGRERRRRERKPCPAVPLHRCVTGCALRSE